MDYFKKYKQFLNIFEILRFLIMGGIGVISYFLFSNFYNWLGVSVYLSPLLAWASGLILVYYGHMKFTYRVQPNHKKMVIRFIIMQSYNLIMSTLSTVYVYKILQFSYMFASIVALAVTVPVLYILGKFWVYS